MASYFEIMDSINRTRTQGLSGGLGALLPYSDDPSSQSYAVFNAPGRVFSDRCRTRDNPFGWVAGTGGNDYPTPLDFVMTPDQWAAKNIDISLNNALSLQFLYGCPTMDQIPAIMAADPFLHPIQPVGTPYGQNTPSQGSVTNLPAGTVPVNPYPAAVAPPPPPPPPPATTTTTTSKGGNVTINFTASRSGNTFYIGDTWTISISGGTPGAAVVADGNPFGTIDTSGNWSKSGSFDSTVVGPWNEHWYVGGTLVGVWQFNVLGTTPPPVTGTTTTGAMHNTTGIVNTTTGTSVADLPSGASALGTDVSSFLTGNMIPNIPNWMLVAGALVVVMMFSMEEGHRR